MSLSIAPSTRRPLPQSYVAALLRIAAVVKENPKLEPVAYGLVRGLGVVEAAPEIEWLAENVQ